MKKSVRISLAAAGVVLLFGMGLWFVPGMKFSAWLCAGIAAALVLWALLRRWGEKSKVGKTCQVVFLAGIVAGLLSFGLTEILLVRAGRTTLLKEPPSAVIVLGAGVNETTPSLVLSSRLDAAVDYLETISPDIPVVLSGGQGPGENVTEAEAMYAYLTERKIDGKRLYREEKSTTTAENLAYSRAILDDLGVDMHSGYVTVVTSDFHMGRVYYLASAAGPMTVCGVTATLPYPWLTANYYAREYFALAKAAWNRLID